MPNCDIRGVGTAVHSGLLATMLITPSRSHWLVAVFVPTRTTPRTASQAQHCLGSFSGA